MDQVMMRSRSRFPHVSVLLAAALWLAGCYYEFDQEFISLESSMEVTGTGRSELHGMRGHKRMPVSYRLERDDYVLYAEIHKDSISPTAVFSVATRTGRAMRIVGHPIRCNASFVPVREGEIRKYGFPEGGYVFTWLPPQFADCLAEHLPEGPERKLTITVYDNKGGEVAVERLAFDIFVNGVRSEIDAP